ncbi:MAG: enoyl-CoA hydratase-related protein [Deltaproteobacteria bacterium]|nr:enoyl-CoA hydratase-related protein [Deltaproteobacteria bacterium]
MSIRREGPVAVLTLRHEEQNRFTQPFLDEYLAALAELKRDGAVRGVVVTSAHENIFRPGSIWNG